MKKAKNPRYPTKLTDDEWNLLLELTTYNKMDCWFDLRECRSGYDFVYDRENETRMSLHAAISQVCEGMWLEDIRRFDNGVAVWNGLVSRFHLGKYSID